MKLQIQVQDEWAAVLVAFLRSVAYVEQVEEMAEEVPPPVASAAEKETVPRLGETHIHGVWDEPDFDVKAWRRQMWSRDV